MSSKPQEATTGFGEGKGEVGYGIGARLEEQNEHRIWGGAARLHRGEDVDGVYLAVDSTH